MEKGRVHEHLNLPSPSSDLEDFVVTFDEPCDPAHPYNWKLSTKIAIFVISSSGAFVVSLTSAIFAPALDDACKEFGVSTEIGALGTSLYILGFGCGTMIWAPASELKGRKWPLTIAMLLGGLFTIGSATAKNIQTLIICRFLAGTCAASQLTVVPGAISDLFDNASRGIAISVYACTFFAGPFVAPIIGGFITANIGWRWNFYLAAILSLTNGVISVLFLRETYPPCLLVTKAKALREETKDPRFYAKQEKVDLDFIQIVEKYFTRPLKMLIMEPIILLLSIYMSFIYGLVYALLEAYPYVFQDVYKMSPGIAGLPFIGLIIGQMLACAFIISQQKSYTNMLEKNNNVPIPEWRLRPAIVGAPIFTLGIFWFGWTGFTSQIHWASPAVAGILIGFGTLCIFLPCFNYLVDAYTSLAASAVAANIIMRSSIAAGFPLFTTQMFNNLGVQWACTVLGCLAAIMIPIPMVFRTYGAFLRGKSQRFQ